MGRAYLNGAAANRKAGSALAAASADVVPRRAVTVTSEASGAHEREADRMAEDAMRAPAGKAPEGAGSRPSPAPGRSVIAEAFGAGAPLDPTARRFFEPKFDASFGEVRVHTGQPAARSADALGALAYTDGRDLVFGPRQYAPGSDAGRRLLGHELAHVVQAQRGLLPGDRLHLKAKAIRFQDEPVLDDVSEGKKVLKQGGAKGEPVIRIGTALAELGKHASAVTSATFDAALATSVTSYQDGKGLKGVVPAGEVEKQTFDALDLDFSSGYQVERDVIGAQSSADLLKGTQTVDADARQAGDQAISTAVRAAPGMAALPAFQPDIGGKGKYADRLKAIVEARIVAQYDLYGKDKAAVHADATQLYDWGQVDVIGKEAQKAADGLFQKYYGGAARPALAKGVNIFDAWDTKVTSLAAGGAPAMDDAAAWRVEKIIVGGAEVKALDIEHGAVQSRAPEAALIKSVKDALVAKYRAELIETHKGWPGFADAGKIYIQRFKGATADAKRRDMWKYFQTFIHEYIHTLEHPDHVAYRSGKSDKAGGMTLREGVTDYLTKIVWSSITVDDALRQKIEGPFHDVANKFPIPALNTYGEAANAERLAGIVGIRNVLAAFLSGNVKLIGQP